MKTRHLKEHWNEHIRIDSDLDIEDLAKHIIATLQELEIIDLSDYDSHNKTLCIIGYALADDIHDLR